ncbi:hypothetical protein FRC12_016499 [Ceratobasidium sp. 428]|nr:hypothetical protein FRC12_016499 [Ceratobasidium sp. 428]
MASQNTISPPSTLTASVDLTGVDSDGHAQRRETIDTCVARKVCTAPSSAPRLAFPAWCTVSHERRAGQCALLNAINARRVVRCASASISFLFPISSFQR